MPDVIADSLKVKDHETLMLSEALVVNLGSVLSTLPIVPLTSRLMCKLLGDSDWFYLKFSIIKYI